MAYQDVRIARRPRKRSAQQIVDPATRRAVANVEDELERLSDEAFELHNRVVNFAVSIGNGLTTIAVTMPIPMPDTSYVVAVNLNFNSGGWWITNKTTTGFTLTWVTATAGTQAARFLIVD